MALLETSKLTKQFGGLVAVNEVDLEVNQGEVMGIIGPNGAGKTTLFNVISGVYKPDGGEIKFQGEKIGGLGAATVAEKRIARTFQAASLFSHMTVLQNMVIASHLYSPVGMWKSFFGTSASRDAQKKEIARALEILEFMDLIQLKDVLAMNLPHGHQKRLGVALALAIEPELLLLDEPVTGMNHEEISSMMSNIERIGQRGITVVVVEHNMRVVMDICKHIAVLDFGKKIAEGPPEDIKNNPQVIQAYLGGNGNATTGN